MNFLSYHSLVTHKYIQPHCNPFSSKSFYVSTGLLRAINPKSCRMHSSPETSSFLYNSYLVIGFSSQSFFFPPSKTDNQREMAVFISENSIFHHALDTFLLFFLNLEVFHTNNQQQLFCSVQCPQEQVGMFDARSCF